MDEFFLIILTASWLTVTERAPLPRNFMDWEQPLHFEWQANVWVSCEAEELTSSHFPPTASALLPCLLSRATRALLLSEKLLGGCCGFHCCERWLHRHHIISLNFKRTHTPKSFFQVLTSPLGLNTWARADKIAQTLVWNQFCQFPSLLRDLAPVIGRNRSVSR